MSDAIEEIRNRYNFRNLSHGLVVAEHADAQTAADLALLVVAVDALRARVERAEKERDEARRLVTSRWPAGGMVPTVALEAEVSKRSDLEREFARYRNATIEDGERLRAEVERLRSSLTAARGEEKEHG
jgi:hypothetical protein